jgi:probable DNA repair protein
MNQGDRQWQRPYCVPWNLWLDKLWEQAGLEAVMGTGRSVPGDWQLISLWESALKAESVKHDLVRPESMAALLRDTRKLVTDWQLDLNDRAWHGNDNENCFAFYRWNKAFERRCKQDNWISPEDRIAILSDAIGNKLFSVSQTIDLLGFDEFNPAQASLLSALVESGTPVCQLSITSRRKKTVLWKSRDEKDELDRMARWVRYWIEKEPDSSIAVVVPDLQLRRQAVERCLEEILVPGGNRSGQQERPWNISMGTKLLRFPMIEAAFDLLNLLDSRIDIQDIGRVLRSPWIRGATLERNSRALLEKCLRDRYPRHIMADEIRYRSAEIKKHDHHHNELPVEQHEPQPWNCPELSTILNVLKRFESDHRQALKTSAWAESFDRLLTGLGWPFAEDSLEQHDMIWQALQSWREALRKLASLDAACPPMRRRTAVNQLKQICRAKIFQARSAPAPVQVLGLYEVSGLRFDHLWVIGLHDDNWPPGARPNPFIPSKLQRAAQIPGSSPQRELAVAATITRRLLETAPDCVFSYPGNVDGEKRVPSPLLESDGITEVSEVPAWQGRSWLGVLTDASPPETTPLEPPGKLIFATAKGGSSILKHQALCPFRAFAINRLGAEKLETPADGISPMLHGSLVHRALEHVWKEIKTQAALLSLEQDDLGALVQKHVDHVTNEVRGLRLRPAFRHVEAARVFRHVMDCLSLEKQREAFEVVAFEKEILPEIEGQAVRLIIDRIDQLTSGEQIIIDYKTGDIDPRKWFGERPEEPQLPLYAINAGKTPSGVVFNIVRDAGCEYKGLVKRGGLLPGLPQSGKANQLLADAGEEMTKTIDEWRQVLHRLMADFLAGEANIDPKNGLDTCQKSYCDLQSVCRIGDLERGRKAGSLADQKRMTE